MSAGLAGCGETTASPITGVPLESCPVWKIDRPFASEATGCDGDEHPAASAKSRASTSPTQGLMIARFATWAGAPATCRTLHERSFAHHGARRRFHRTKPSGSWIRRELGDRLGLARVLFECQSKLCLSCADRRRPASHHGWRASRRWVPFHLRGARHEPTREAPLSEAVMGTTQRLSRDDPAIRVSGL